MFGRKRVLRMPGWSLRASGPRVLIEDSDWANAWAADQLLTKAGYRVATCPGPEEMAKTECPLLEGGRCLAVEEADVIICNFDQEGSRARMILKVHLARSALKGNLDGEASVPAVITSARGVEGDVGSTQVLTPSPTSAALLAAVDAASGRHSRNGARV